MTGNEIPQTHTPASDQSSEKSLSAADRLIVALDLPSREEALELAAALQGVCRWVKVGMELYYAAGSATVELLRARGFEVFLDLKLHDIPNTVASAVRTISSAGASLLTVHAGGGPAMLRAAAEAASTPNSPRLLAVTVLTSMDAEQLRAVGVDASPDHQVTRLARLAKANGINGLVCSPQEAREVRTQLGPEALVVTPGVRPAGANAGDQKRIATPADALRNGASMLVVGRPITKAADPAAAAQAILREMDAALNPDLKP